MINLVTLVHKRVRHNKCTWSPELERTIAEAKALKEAKQQEKVAGGTDYSNSPSGYSIDYGSINNAINILSSLVGNDLKKTKGGRKLKTKVGPNESKEKKEGKKGRSSEGEAFIVQKLPS